MLTNSNENCQSTLSAKEENLMRWRTREGIRAATFCSVTNKDVIRTEQDSKHPTIPIIPRLSARPCRKVREVVLQIRLRARSMTENTHVPAHNTIPTQLTITPVPTLERDSTVVRKNLPNPGYPCVTSPRISTPVTIR